MRLLFDTCSFVWFYSDPGQLSARAVTLLTDPTAELYLSPISIWELLVKSATGKLTITGDLGLIVEEQRRVNGVFPLPVTFDHVFQLPALLPHHKDPFDRLLICQALAEGMTLLTPDPLIRLYQVSTDW